jgi:transposase-like protein
MVLSTSNLGSANELITVGLQQRGRWRNNRAENSQQPFRRWEGAMAKFRNIRSLQKFAAVHALIQNHFNLDRHLHRRSVFKAEPRRRPGGVASVGGVKSVLDWLFGDQFALN